MLIGFLIKVLVVFGVFIVLRFFVRKVMSDGETQQLVLMILGIIALIFLLVEAAGMLGIAGRQRIDFR